MYHLPVRLSKYVLAGMAKCPVSVRHLPVHTYHTYLYLVCCTYVCTCSARYVVVFTLNPSFYPTPSAVPPVSFLILHPRAITSAAVTDSETEKPNAIDSRQANQVLAYRVREHNKTKRHPRNKSYEKKILDE